MNNTISYSACPYCNSTNFDKVLSVKDYTVSNEMFDVYHCSSCTNRFTQNIPSIHSISKYYQSDNYISHSDTNKDFISKIYHAVRKRTLIAKKNIVEKFTQKTKGKHLDVGAGTGAFAHTMVQAGWQVTALEPDETARKIAATKHNLQLQNPDELFSFSSQTFDCITLWHVLEHVHPLKEYLQQFNKLLTANGVAIIAVPNYTSYDANYYQQFWAGYDVPRHLYHFSPKGFEQLAKANGLTLIKTLPMWFDSVYVSMLSEKYKTGKASFIKALFIGLLSNCKALFNSKKCSSVIYILQKSK